jgi:outer membrane protein assembly factor BamB
MVYRTILVICCVPISSAALAGNWPSWRGPAGTGVSSERGVPTHWSKTENVRWRVPLPDRGNSTPIVWGNRVFITQAIEKEQRRSVMCFDRSSGKLIWQQGVTYTEPEVTHATNPQCSASPVTDGERVIASFASAGLFCYDFAGNELWHRDLGKQAHIWGNGASPILHEDLCILNFGPGERTFLIALNKRTGETVWQVDEPGGKFGKVRSEWVGSWSTPIIIEVNGRSELVMSFPQRTCAFDPKTGMELWTCQGMGDLVYTSPLWGDGVLVSMGGFNGPYMAVRPGGDGDVTATHRLWRVPRAQQRIGSGVITGGHIYILNDPGVAECIELATGKVVGERRLEGPEGNRESWSSMVLAEGRLYVVNKAGDTFVVKPSPAFEVLSTSSIGEPTFGSLALSDGEVFIRSYEALWCIGSSGAAAAQR